MRLLEVEWRINNATFKCMDTVLSWSRRTLRCMNCYNTAWYVLQHPSSAVGISEAIGEDDVAAESLEDQRDVMSTVATGDPVGPGQHSIGGLAGVGILIKIKGCCLEHGIVAPPSNWYYQLTTNLQIKANSTWGGRINFIWDAAMINYNIYTHG